MEKKTTKEQFREAGDKIKHAQRKITCPKCNKSFWITEQDLEDWNALTCPFCHNEPIEV